MACLKQFKFFIVREFIDPLLLPQTEPCSELLTGQWNLQIFSGFLEAVDFLSQKIHLCSTAQLGKTRTYSSIIDLIGLWTRDDNTQPVQGHSFLIPHCHCDNYGLLLEHVTAETSSVNMPGRNICNCFYPVMQVGWLYIAHSFHKCTHLFICQVCFHWMSKPTLLQPMYMRFGIAACFRLTASVLFTSLILTSLEWRTGRKVTFFDRWIIYEGVLISP